LLPAEELPAQTPAVLKARVRTDAKGETEFVLVEDGATTVAVTQRDVREVQLASGALRAGIRILLKHAGLEPCDLQELLIAGGFGSFIRRTNAQQIGILPHEIEKHRLKYVGNVALGGAMWALLSSDARKEAEEYARTVKHVELSTDVNFQMEFAEAMIFPEAR
jgi:uncharacterized 2Fe-2S/4Fe-4S cluster protein (DUF4445 family)